MLANLEVWQGLLFSEKIEGGFSDRPLADDPGSWTMHGISRAALAAHRGVELTEIGREDVRNLSLEEAKACASADYWNPPRCSDMTGGIDVYAADFAFNSGPRQAVRTLQRVLGLDPADVDGFCGPMSLKAISKRDPRELIESYHQARMAFLRGLKNWESNKNGWQARCEAMRDLALTLAPKTAPAAFAKADGKRRSLATALSIAGTAATAMLPDVLEATNPAKAAYQQTAALLEPYSVYSRLVVPLIGGVVILAVIFNHVRAKRMAHNAKAAGVVAEVVAG